MEIKFPYGIEVYLDPDQFRPNIKKVEDKKEIVEKAKRLALQNMSAEELVEFIERWDDE